MRHENETFNHAAATIDGNEYLGCKFNNCHLTFGALAPVTLEGCQFNACTWGFTGPAALTIEVMRGLYAAGADGERLILNTFKGAPGGAHLH